MYQGIIQIIEKGIEELEELKNRGLTETVVPGTDIPVNIENELKILKEKLTHFKTLDEVARRDK